MNEEYTGYLPACIPEADTIDTIGEMYIPPDDEIEVDDAFSYSGYQVVRGEFFAHVREPSITFNNCMFSVNTACINRMPDTDYVQILISREERKLVVLPCGEDDRDAFLWCSVNKKTGKKQPKKVTCRIFYAKVFEMMKWDPDYRYKLIGKLIQANGVKLFVFDLTAIEIYQKMTAATGKANNSRTPAFPKEWQDQFGLPYETHQKSLQVNIVEGYTVFDLKSRGEKSNISDGEVFDDKQS